MVEIEAVRGGLFDRVFHISNPIYCQVDGRGDVIDPEEYRTRLIGMNPIVIYCCLSNQERMLQGIVEHTKVHKPAEYLELVKKNHFQITQLYDESFRQLEGKIPIIYYSWEEDLPALVLQTIKQIEAETCVD